MTSDQIVLVSEGLDLASTFPPVSVAFWVFVAEDPEHTEGGRHRQFIEDHFAHIASGRASFALTCTSRLLSDA